MEKKNKFYFISRESFVGKSKNSTHAGTWDGLLPEKQ